MVAAAGYISLVTLSAKDGSDCVLFEFLCYCAVCDHVAVLALATVYVNSLNRVVNKMPTLELEQDKIWVQLALDVPLESMLEKI